MNLLRYLTASLIVAAAAAVLPATASAQREYSPNLAIGGKAGMTMSRMSFSPEVKQSFNNGMMAGVVVRYTEERFSGLSVKSTSSSAVGAKISKEHPSPIRVR